LSRSAIKILIVWYSAFKERTVVIDPAPAIRGKAIGKIDPDPAGSCLKSSTPRIISIAIRKMIKEPAMANDDTSIPKIPRRGLPINKKARKIRNETTVTLSGFITPDFDLISIIIGMDPGISIIAKSTIKAAIISIRFKCIICCFYSKLIHFSRRAIPELSFYCLIVISSTRCRAPA
jgi:hypothetical protein